MNEPTGKCKCKIPTISIDKATKKVNLRCKVCNKMFEPNFKTNRIINQSSKDEKIF